MAGAGSSVAGEEPRQRIARMDNSSLTDRVLAAIVAEIQNGTFPEGKLPSEPDLARNLGVSRTTVRAALSPLEQLGVLERRPGLGTRLRSHVTPDVLAMHGLVPFSTLLAANHSLTSDARLGIVSRWHDRLTKRLGSVPPGRVYEITRVHYADGRPAMLLRELIPEEMLAEPLTEAGLRRSIIELSRDCFRTDIDHAVARLIPRTAGKSVSELFSLPRRTPYVLLEETFYGGSNQPLALADVTVNPAFIELSVFRRMAGWQWE